MAHDADDQRYLDYVADDPEVCISLFFFSRLHPVFFPLLSAALQRGNGG